MIPKKTTKMIVKDGSGNLVQLLPEIETASAIDASSDVPVSSAALASALEDIEDSLPASALLDVMDEEPTALNTTELDDEALIVWMQPQVPSWSITINTELVGAGEKKGQIPFNLYALKERFQTYASITVNWGNGNTVTYNSADANENKCITYEYASPGIYTITMSSESFDELYIWSKLYNDVDDPLIYTTALISINSALPTLAGTYGYLGSGDFTLYGENSFDSCFQGYSNLQSIPADLFINNPTVTNFKGCFCFCTSLATIPSTLFSNNVSASTFDYCFKGCTSLQSIPEELFSSNIANISFYECFEYCTSLNDFTLHIGSSSVSNCSSFVNKKTGTTRTIYVPSGSTTQTKFNAVASSLGLTIIGE